jgi:hypothetical protein
MKRIVLMVMLLVAGGLALVYVVASLFFLVQVFPSFAMSAAATGSGGVGSVSAGISETLVELGLWLLPSVLLWRVYASLAAGGDRVMARHRRIHGVAIVAGLPAVVIVAFLMLPLMAFGLAAVQLFSVVVAFRTLMRGGRETLEAS